MCEYGDMMRFHRQKESSAAVEPRQHDYILAVPFYRFK